MTDTLANLDAMLARLEALEARAGLDVVPFAAGDLPPYVAAGELITSAWGNAVVDALKRSRDLEVPPFTPFGSDVGSRTGPGAFIVHDQGLAAYAYPVRVTVWLVVNWGFSGGLPTGNHNITRKDTGATVGAVNDQPFQGGGQYQATPTMASWTVTPGLQPGFHTVTSITNATNAYLNHQGIYHVQRIP